mmetsp:Transcript_12501/g.33733  ORF Transcript_12501/g.33733 Transcript_12501/m.33733 type:complete len:413 (+) Transcript_12501:119-1357(+)
MTCEVHETDLSNVGLALGITAAAGLSTTLGAAVSFCAPSKAASARKFLAASLALAAGVMTFVSFVEIFATKTVGSFAECVPENLAFLYATLCFFAGIVLTFLLDRALHALEHFIARHENRRAAQNVADSSNSSGDEFVDAKGSNDVECGRTDVLEFGAKDIAGDEADEVNGMVTKSSSSSTRGGSLSSQGFATSRLVQVNNIAASDRRSERRDDEIVPASRERSASGGGGGETFAELATDEEIGHDGIFVAQLYESAVDRKALARMGMFAGVAIAFHNFPEGLATFIAVLEDPSVGASVAIAIAIHNIPEGICVAMPIYYASGSRWKAFFWATLSGLTELVGAFLGWVVLRSVFTPVAYGVLFGVVAGMMVYISLKELLPAAHRYDPQDSVSTFFFCVGMVVIALSLVLFKF